MDSDGGGAPFSNFSGSPGEAGGEFCCACAEQVLGAEGHRGKLYIDCRSSEDAV